MTRLSHVKAVSRLGTVITLSIADCLFSQSPQIQISKDRYQQAWKAAKKLEHIFRKVHEIELTAKEELVVAEISSCVVGESNQILCVDEKLQAVFLFDSKGSLQGKVNQEIMEQSKPGHKFNPFQALFDREGNVYVQSLFDREGLLHKFDKNLNYIAEIRYHDFNSAFHFIFDGSNNLISYIVVTPFDIFLKKTVLSKKSGNKFGVFPEEFGNAINRNPIRGLAIDQNDRVYQVNAVEPKIYVYDSGGSLLKTYEDEPAGYHKISKDLPGEITMSNLGALKNFMNWTMTISIHYLTSGLLLVQYYDHPTQKFLFDLWDIEGKCYTNGVLSPDRILAAKDSSIFFEYQPPMNKSGDLPNPRIVQYDLINR